MACPQCGGRMQRLAASHYEFEYDSDDEVIGKTTTEIYERCESRECDYMEIIDVIVEEGKMPYEIVLG